MKKSKLGFILTQLLSNILSLILSMENYGEMTEPALNELDKKYILNELEKIKNYINQI